MDEDCSVSGGRDAEVRVLVGLCIGALVVQQIAVAVLDDLPSTEIVEDAEVMALTVERLTRLQPYIDDLPTYPGTTAEAATVTRCGSDSGDVFQPSVHRTWTVHDPSDMTEVAERIADDLRDAGWSVPPTPSRWGDIGPITFVTAEGWRATGSIFTFDPAPYREPGQSTVSVSAHIDDLVPCSID